MRPTFTMAHMDLRLDTWTINIACRYLHRHPKFTRPLACNKVAWGTHLPWPRTPKLPLDNRCQDSMVRLSPVSFRDIKVVLNS